MNENKVEHYFYTADTFHCDFNHDLCFGHLGNAMLNAADVHSTQRNFGMSYLNTINKTWVLSRLAIEMAELPVEHTPLCIDTWVENAMKYFTKRNWCIREANADGTEKEDGKIYGYGKSIWAMIDTTTREPQDILQIHKGEITEYTYPEKECPMKDVSRVKTPELEDYTEFVVRYSDIDVNGHLNSMKYVDHVLDLFAPEVYKTSMIKRLEIAYVAEGHYGDTIRIYNKQESDGTWYFRMVRAEDDTELSRLAITFTEKK